MSFLRTPAGLSNLHLFFTVDAVVFVEGGDESFSFEDLLNERFNTQSPDIKFWELLFGIFLPDRKCHYRAVGSKNTLYTVAALMTSGTVKHVILCMDRDYDHLTGRLAKHPSILYTFGYSWENDIWTSKGIFAAFQRFSTGIKDANLIENEIHEQFVQLKSRLRWAVRAYALLASCNTKGLHIEPLKSVIRCPRNAAPYLDLEALRKIVRGSTAKKTTKVPIRLPLKTDPLVDCYGHMLAMYGFHLLYYLVRKYARIRTFPRDVAIPVAIGTIGDHIASDSVRYAYYTKSFATIPW